MPSQRRILLLCGVLKLTRASYNTRIGERSGDNIDPHPRLGEDNSSGWRPAHPTAPVYLEAGPSCLPSCSLCPVPHPCPDPSLCYSFFLLPVCFPLCAAQLLSSFLPTETVRESHLFPLVYFLFLGRLMSDSPCSLPPSQNSFPGHCPEWQEAPEQAVSTLHRQGAACPHSNWMDRKGRCTACSASRRGIVPYVQAKQNRSPAGQVL